MHVYTHIYISIYIYIYIYIIGACVTGDTHRQLSWKHAGLG